MTRYKISNQESGMASFLVTLFLMLIITLVVIGFARFIRREQRQVLDRQLSTQAFYAAESGVNDAIKAFQGGFNSAKTTCGIDATFTNNVLDAGNNVSYPCLLIDPSPTSLIFDNIGIPSATVIPINASSVINNITISWEATTLLNNGFSGCWAAGSFNPAVLSGSSNYPSDCDAGILRIDLVPTSGTLSRNSLSGGLIAFLSPSTSASATLAYGNASGTKAGEVVAGSCNIGNSPRRCTVTINGLPGGNKYYLRALSIYKSNGLTVTAKNTSNNNLALSGTQAQVDSTGKANDVLRRISVRVDLSAQNKGVPIGAIQSTTSVCKRFGVGPDFATYDGTGVPGSLDVSACDPSTP